MTEVTILVADEHIEAIEDVAAALREAGLRLGLVLPSTGVITGSVDNEAALEALAAVDGVAGVEQAQEIALPPPDEPIQ